MDINKTDCHVISEILLKVALNIITLTPNTSKWKLTDLKMSWIFYVNIRRFVKDYYDVSIWITFKCHINHINNILNNYQWKKYHMYIIGNLYMFPLISERPSWSWSYGSWIYNYLCNKYLSLLTLWVWIPLEWCNIMW